jgi:hypothetical protein
MFVPFSSSLGNELIDNLRPSGVLRWKGETTDWEGQEVVCGKSAPPMLYSPPVSVKNQWVGPHEQVLNIPIAWWWYGSSKPSSLSLTEAWLKSTASLVGLGEKLGTNPWIGQSAWCELYQEPFFSKAVGSVQVCQRLVKGCHVRGLAVGSVHIVLVGISPVGFTSIWITVTLRYE